MAESIPVDSAAGQRPVSRRQSRLVSHVRRRSIRATLRPGIGEATIHVQILMTAFRIGFAAWALLTASLFAATRADRTHRSNCNPVGSRLVGHVRRFHGVRALPCADLRPVEADAHGERRPRSERASRRHHPGPRSAQSARHLHQGPDRLRVRQQVEAALFHEGRRRLLSARRPVGRHASSMAAVQRRDGNRLVDRLLSAGEQRAADGTDVRRLPLGELQRQDEDRHGVERRLREMPRSGQRARRAARRAPPSSTRRASIRSARQRRACSATRRAVRSSTRSRAATTTGRWVSASD